MNPRIYLKVREKIRETEQAATLVLEVMEGDFHYQAGQFLTFIFDGLAPEEVRRSYSMSSAPGVDPFPAVTVQRQANGSASRYLVEAVHPGDVLKSLPPAGQFTLPAGEGAPRDIFLIGGGSGITPLFSLIKYALHSEPRSRIVLIDANHDEQSIIFREALLNLAREHPRRFQSIHLLSEPKTPLKELKASFQPSELIRGRLSNTLLEKLVGRCLSCEPSRAQFFLCGPKGLMLKAENTLGFMGFTPEQVHREIFTVLEPFRPPAENFPDSRIKLDYRGRTYFFDLKKGQTILEAALNAGIELPYSCRSGVCTTCAMRCLKGKVEMYAQTGRQDTDATRGLTLTCVGYPATDEVELG
jgi:ring-1,2-phenylacetyl-CoA epoxidase subunit PaaE